MENRNKIPDKIALLLRFSSGKNCNLRGILFFANSHALRFLLTVLRLCGFIEILENCAKNDFVYLDPPYAIKNRRIFNQYSPDTFGLNDLERMKDLLVEINNRNANFILSYADCDEAKILSEDWKSTVVCTVRNIWGFAKHRKMENEVIITNID